MQTDKIALIAPNKEFMLRTVDLLSEWGGKIHVAMASQEDVVAIAQQLGERGADALICYADFVDTIKPVVNIPTVSLQPSSLDILRSMQWAKTWLTRHRSDLSEDELIVGITGGAIIHDATFVASMLGMKVRHLVAGQDLPEVVAVIKSVADVADPEEGQPVILDNDIPCFTVAIGRQALFTSVQSAREVLFSGQVSRVKLEQLKTIMEFTGEGIIAVDSQRHVIYMNHMAERLLKKSREDIVGNVAAGIFPDINLEDSLKYGQTRTALLVDSTEQVFSSRIVPMIIGGQAIGAVVMLAESPLLYKEKKKLGEANYCFDDFVTVNTSMEETLAAAKSYAEVGTTILIYGATGTGKEIIAQSIHNYSQRRFGPFVAVNCTALPESLLESELFGYEYGAFTGARKNGKKGLFEQADQGTIFLDEIGDISLGMQARLLRVVQQREIMRIGGDKVIPVDVGIVSATHRNLRELVEQGLFRRDLYYRLSILQLKLLPLSSRKEDIPCLVAAIGARLAVKLSRQQLQFRPGAMNVLTQYQWPGNVRELEGVIERLLILKQDGVVEADDIRKVLDWCDLEHNDTRIVPKGTMEEIEQAIIKQVLQETGNHDQAAKILGISTTTIWRKMRTIQNEKNGFKLNGCDKSN